jgi:hypothetical protein
MMSLVARRRPRAFTPAVLLCLGAALAAGCSAASGASSAPGPAAGASASAAAAAQPTPSGKACGSAHTGVGVPVIIKVTKGSVDCATALQVQDSYSAMVAHGALQGNGGGAPLSVSGWTCQGYPTPQVLATGVASECHTTSAELVAVLAMPTATSASSAAGPSASAS